MDWRDKIIKDPKIMSGRPVIKGTRITVELILELQHNGWTESDILQNYPHLTAAGIQACLSYAENHRMIAFADWDHEMCPQYWHEFRPEINPLPCAE